MVVAIGPEPTLLVAMRAARLPSPLSPSGSSALAPTLDAGFVACTGWTPDVPKKTNRPREWTVGFRASPTGLWKKAA